jgi:hypothetical protein
MLVGRIELHAAAHPQESGTSNQRDVVEVDDVEVLGVEQTRDGRAIDNGPADLVGQENRKYAEPATEPDDPHPGGLRPCRWFYAGVQSVVRVDVAHHRYVMTAAGESAGQSLNADRIPAKAVRWIKRSQVTETKGSRHGVGLSPPDCAMEALGLFRRSLITGEKLLGFVRP